MEKDYRKLRPMFHLHSIRIEMLIYFLPVIAAAFLMVFLFSVSYSEKNAQYLSTNYGLQLIRQVNRDIDSYITYMENISILESENPDIRSYLKAGSDRTRQGGLRENIISQFKNVLETRTDIYNIGIVSADGEILMNDGSSVLNPYTDVKKQKWYQDAISSEGGKVALLSSHVQNIVLNEYPWVVTLSRSLGFPGQEDGVFFIDLNYSAINNLCENIDLGTRGYVFIIDQSGNIIYHPKQQLIYSGLKTEMVQEVLNSSQDYFMAGKGKDRKLYMVSSSEKTGWTTVGVAYEPELIKNRSITRTFYTLVAVLLLVALIWIITLLSRRITMPITILQQAMRKAEGGNFEKIDLSLLPENEAGSLGRTFNIMADEIKFLVEENTREQELKRKSELKVLQSQINPHFLYNTLDSIVWMAEGGKNKEVVKMTMALSKLLRSSISNEQEQVTISQEKEYVRNYLEIQQMRYKDMLEYEIDISPEIESCPIIKLVLQPLVENAIYHGIKYRESGGFVSIKGWKEGGEIMLEVRDNGPGMTEEQLETIFQMRKTNYKRNGVGVYNVQTRLQLYYGKEYGIRFASAPGMGTVAVIHIPLRKWGDSAEKG